MDTTRRASTVYRWAGYVGTLAGEEGWLEGSNPWHLQPRLLQQSLGCLLLPSSLLGAQALRTS